MSTPFAFQDSTGQRGARPRRFLGVERSLTGQVWRDRLDERGQANAAAIVQQTDLPELLSRVLAGRGLTPGDAAAYLDPSLRALMPDPVVLTGMLTAVTRLTSAIESGQTVAIFGDYDVDGAASAALLAEFLTHCGTPVRIHIPHRIQEGYGPNVQAIRALAEAGANLLVTVDCGTTSHGPIAQAARLGLDPIVIDHHQADPLLPEAHAIVNPNRQDDLSGLSHLCAAAVVFMVLVALNRSLRHRGFWTPERPEPDLLDMIDLVALGTIADVVPLIGLNRAFVTKGLRAMRARRRPGLTALFDVGGADGPPRPYHLGFVIGPRINAGGRIGDASLGARLLLERDEARAMDIARELDRLNRERQVVEAGTLAQAEAEAEASLGPGETGLTVVTAGEGWHPGVVGLVASRLRERYRRPAFAIAFEGGIGTGSGRSIPGVDLGRVVQAAVAAGILVKGGGHAMAAGITIEAARLGDFRGFLEETLGPALAAARARDAIEIDAALTASAVTPGLIEGLDRAGPYGAGNPEPVLAFPAHRIVDVGQVGADHVRLTAMGADRTKLNAIAFRAAGNALGQGLLRARGLPMHLVGTLSINRHGGTPRPQLRIIDAADPAAVDA